MDCAALEALAAECGTRAKTGINPNVFLIRFEDLALIEGSVDVFTKSVTGLVSEIGLKAGKIFIKAGTVINQGSITDSYTENDNGSFDITKGLVFSLTNMGSLSRKTWIESLFGQPVAALVRLNSGSWIAIGLNGQFRLKTSEGTVDGSSNGRVLTLNGSDSELSMIVDPTIISDLITAA